MDLMLFCGCLCVGTAVGLTLKKNQVYLMPQSLDIFMSNREYFDQVQKEQEKHDRDIYFSFKNSTRHLNSPRD